VPAAAGKSTSINQQPRACRSRSAPEFRTDGVHNGRDGLIEIRVGKHDLRALAAELQGHRAMALYAAACWIRVPTCRAAGEADVVDAGIARQGVANFTDRSR